MLVKKPIPHGTLNKIQIEFLTQFSQRGLVLSAGERL